MIRPAIERSVDALERAVAGAGLASEQVDRIPLVGGSSRIPLVSQILAARLGRPIALDAHPKHAVALGAARLSATALQARIPAAPVVATAPGPVAQGPPVAPGAAVPPATAPGLPAAGESRRPGWVPVVAVVAAVAVLGGAVAAVLGGGGDDGGESPRFERAGDGEEPLPDLVAVTDATDTITVEVPDRWNSVGGLPIGFADSDVVAPDLVVSTDEEAFQASVDEPGIRIRYFSAAAIESFGVLGDVDGLAGSEVDDFDLPGTCGGEFPADDLDVAEFEGSVRLFEECGRATVVMVFGGFDNDGAGLVVVAHLADAADEAVMEAVVASIAVRSSPSSGTRPRSEVGVQILNAAGPASSASELSQILAAAGFAVHEPANLAEAGAGVQLFAADGFMADAVAVAIVLELSAEPEPMPPDRPAGAAADAHVLVVLGEGFVP